MSNDGNGNTRSSSKNKESYWKRAENGADLADLRRLQAAILPVARFLPQP